MEITDVRIFLREDGMMKAFAAVTFDASFVVHNIRVLEGQKGIFISMPAKKKKDGKYLDVAHPITTEMRHRLDNAVIEKYKQALAKKAGEARSAPVSADTAGADKSAQPLQGPAVSDSVGRPPEEQK